ncbi:MAG: hypothetical protein KAS97_12190 [Candidatus Aminicenantes bacterium]|nr:hypothetical protein [Candidatus Aminicenantes bacterium]
MKKGNFLRKTSFVLFLFSLLLIYLWIYLLPSIKKINVLKRDIKEYSLRISNAQIEKAVFVQSDNKELQLFREVELEFVRKLKVRDILEGSFKSTMKKTGEKAGIIGLKISEVIDSGEDGELSSSFEGFLGIKIKRTELKFSAGFRYGAEFIRLFPDTGQYLLIKSINAKRSGLYYIFNINIEHHYRNNNTDTGNPAKGEQNDLIDMDSPILRKPVYFSPMRLKKSVK